LLTRLVDGNKLARPSISTTLRGLSLRHRTPPFCQVLCHRLLGLTGPMDGTAPLRCPGPAPILVLAFAMWPRSAWFELALPSRANGTAGRLFSPRRGLEKGLGARGQME
jgi:hypothetical protein